MLYSGLVSITFREHSPREVVELVAQAGLDGIEWGGDVHVPPGDLPRAREVAQRTRDAGLQVNAYGSFYLLRQDEPAAFEDVLATALELGAPVIRVWAGDRASADANNTYRERIAAETRRCADLAQQAGVTIAYEYHGGTLTDTRDSAVALLQAVEHPNVKTLWQPAQKTTFEERSADLDAVLPWLHNIHVFQWGAGGYQDRLTLAEGQAEWSAYIQKISAAPGDRSLSLEFVIGDAPEQFLRDAATLKAWLADANA